jgi:benzoyl-CoA reductase/2-hydroxyglutaryl-CoA dehydratase subunit BcrC/BadD/HgdB
MMEQKTKTRYISRLNSRNIVRPMVNKMYSEGVLAAKEGRPLVWSMVNWWEGDLVMRAMDVTPIYPENFGTVCASTGMAQKYQAICDAEGFPTHLCGYSRNHIGYAAEMKRLGKIPEDAPLGGMGEPTFMLGSGIGCDTRFKWFQALRQYYDVPVWTIDTPSYDVSEDINSGIHEENIGHKVKELERFIAFLENLLGKKIDMDRLAEYVENQEKVFQLWWEINELRKATPCPMHSRDFWTLMVPGYYMTSDKEALNLYQQVYDEVKARVDEKTGAVTPEKYRLMFAELPPWHSLDFFEKLAERGWDFVVESQGYHPPEPMTLEPSGNTLERLTRWTYWVGVGHILKARKLNFPEFGPVQHYYNWAREYKVDGFITHSLLSCRTATFWLTHASNILRDELDIPSMNMEGDIVDFTVFDPDEVLKNAQAFEESMDHYRQERKNKGLDW